VNEPTRAPRLLTADQIAIAFHLLREVHPQVTEVVKAHIAAQDQRHAALVAVVRKGIEPSCDCRHDCSEVSQFYDDLAKALAALAQPPGDE
jgi:hypothetical protein